MPTINWYLFGSCTVIATSFLLFLLIIFWHLKSKQKYQRRAKEYLHYNNHVEQFLAHLEKEHLQHKEYEEKIIRKKESALLKKELELNIREEFFLKHLDDEMKKKQAFMNMHDEMLRRESSVKIEQHQTNLSPDSSLPNQNVPYLDHSHPHQISHNTTLHLNHSTNLNQENNSPLLIENQSPTIPTLTNVENQSEINYENNQIEENNVIKTELNQFESNSQDHLVEGNSVFKTDNSDAQES